MIQTHRSTDSIIMSTSINQPGHVQAFRRRRFSRRFRMGFRAEQASLGHVVEGGASGGFSLVQVEEKHWEKHW